MNKNRISIRVLALVFVLSLILGSLPLYANERADFNNKDVKDASNITVYVNGEKLNFDTPAKLSSGRTLVPLRKIAEALGYTVQYDAKLKRIVLQYGYQFYELTIGSNFVYATEASRYDHCGFALEVVPAIYQSRTYVPLRTIAELCSAQVVWDGKTKTIRIDAPKVPENEIKTLESPFDAVGRYRYDGQLKDGRPEGTGFMQYGYEFSSFYQGRWVNGLPQGPGFMMLVTGVDTWSITGEFAAGRLQSGTVVSSNGISIIREGKVFKSFAQAADAYWVVPLDESLNDAWQQTLITELPELK